MRKITISLGALGLGVAFSSVSAFAQLAPAGPNYGAGSGDRYGPNGTGSLSVWARITPSDIHPPFDPETIVQSRILAVTDYLNRIQEK